MAATQPSLVLRIAKQQPLTALEMDNNLSNLLQYALDIETQLVNGTTAFTNFSSTGIDDNATATALTLDSSNNATLSGNLAVNGSLNGSTLTLTGNITLSTAGSTVDGRDLTADGSKLDAATAAKTNNALVQRDATGSASLDVNGNVTGDLTGNVTGQVSTLANHDTDVLAEGSNNLYHTTSRARNALSAAATEIDYDSGTGVFSLPNSGVTAGTHGSATAIPEITVDAKGRVTSVTERALSGADQTSYTSTGSHTWTKPAGAKLVQVLCFGGGAGGAGTWVNNTHDTCFGGHGAVVEDWIDVTNVTSVAVTVGAGGTAGKGLPNQSGHVVAGNGGDSSFGSYITAKGGLGTNGQGIPIPANPNGGATASQPTAIQHETSGLVNATYSKGGEAPNQGGYSWQYLGDPGRQGAVIVNVIG